MRYAILAGIVADLPDLATGPTSLDRVVLRAALAWGDDAPDTRGSRCPELDARDAAAAHQGPRDVEDDATPSSRPRALEEMGIGARRGR